MKQMAYEYGNLPIPGGGYVTGFLFSKKEKDVLYARTDIGGTYRFDYKTRKWISLISHVTMVDLSETFPIALAIDEEKLGSLFIACGVNRRESGVLAISEDYGETFRYETIPTMIHGNLNGRGTDERLWVEGEKLWFASQTGGLYYSEDLGKNWSKLTAMPEEYLTFVTKIDDTLIVGSAGVTTSVKDDETAVPLRGHCLYYSSDNGVTFEKMAVPESHVVEGCRYNGLVAQRWEKDEKYFYVTFASTGRSSYVLENGYSCDSGDNIDGHIVRYPLTNLNKPEEITPGVASTVRGIGQENITKGQMLEYGFSGICASKQTPGMLVATTIVKWDGDSVFRSMDYGETWQQILYGLEEGEITFRAPYMQPECNGGHSLIHWLSDFKINPFNDNEGWFNSGTGVFLTENLKAGAVAGEGSGQATPGEQDAQVSSGKQDAQVAGASGQQMACNVKFTDWCDGIEETVHLNVYSCPKGDMQVIDIVGDLGGFAFEDVDKPCKNSFADAEGNRYITCINADFSDEKPELLVVTPRGNWTGKTFGGLILSKDQGRTFRRLPMPFGLSEKLDEALHMIERPNVNSGWVAMSPNGQNIVWSVAQGIDLPIEKVIVSHDGGESFKRCVVLDKVGNVKTTGKLKVFSDRMDSERFYGFGEASQIYISCDGGETYREQEVPPEFPKIEFGLIDCANKTEVRGETGKSGVFYLAIGAEGLWKLSFKTDKDGKATDANFQLTRLTAPGITVYRMGLGLGTPGGDYYKDPKAIYFNGIVENQYGFYCTFDEGKTFERLNTDKQMFGEINSIDGDCRTFGRFFLATGSNGLKYGRRIG